MLDLRLRDRLDLFLLLRAACFKLEALLIQVRSVFEVLPAVLLMHRVELAAHTIVDAPVLHRNIVLTLGQLVRALA